MIERVWLEHWLKHRAHIALLLILALRLGLPLDDPHIAEYAPWHQHLVFGARSTAELKSVLASHHHSYEQRNHRHSAAGPGAVAASQAKYGAIQVVAFVQPANSAIAVSAMADPALIIPIVNYLPARSFGLGRPFAASLPVELGVEFPPPIPPPRAAIRSCFA
jgi:hypothetical protein